MSSAVSVITELQGKDRLKAAVEEEAKTPSRLMEFERYDALARFRPTGRGFEAPQTGTGPSGRVLVCELGPDEFFVMGFDSAVEFRPGVGSGYAGAQFLIWRWRAPTAACAVCGRGSAASACWRSVTGHGTTGRNRASRLLGNLRGPIPDALDNPDFATAGVALRQLAG
jgi:hypothetical protein